MVRLQRTIAIAVSSLFLMSCSDTMVVSERSGVPLNELDLTGAAPAELGLSGPDEIILTQGDKLSIAVSGDPSAIEALRFRRDGDALQVMRKSQAGGNLGTATIRITMPAPERLALSGSGSIAAPGLARDAAIDSNGSGKIEIDDIQTDRLDIGISGSSRIAGSGRTESMDISVNGSGIVDFRQLRARQAKISSAGSGDITFASDGTVSASIAGSGNVRVIGDAKCDGNIAGSGSLDCGPAS